MSRNTITCLAEHLDKKNPKLNEKVKAKNKKTFVTFKERKSDFLTPRKLK